MSSVKTQAHEQKDSIEAVLLWPHIVMRQVTSHVQSFRIVHGFSHFVMHEVRKAFQDQDENITTHVQGECARDRCLLDNQSKILIITLTQETSLFYLNYQCFDLLMVLQNSLSIGISVHFATKLGFWLYCYQKFHKQIHLIVMNI